MERIMEIRKNRHCTYALNYHLVLVVKYRKPCIDDDIAKMMIEKTAQILQQNKGRLIEANADKDHIHFLFELSPSKDLSKLVGVIKGVLARLTRKEFADRIDPYLWGDSFWSDSYFIASSGGVSIDVLKQYIENQGKPKRTSKRQLAADDGNSSPP